MRHSYDIYERLPNGFAIWHVRVLGRYEAERRMFELAEHSSNRFFAIDVVTKELLPSVEQVNSVPAN